MFGLSAAAQTTTYSNLTSNNTAACAAAGSPSYCQAGFNGMSDSTSGTYNAAPGNVSVATLQSLLYAGNSTMMFTYLMPWFCMNSGSTVTGSTSVLCDSHIQVGYNSNDSATVNGQASDMIRRGFQGVIIDWYGPTLGFPYDQVSQKFQSNLNGRCSGPQSCPLLLGLMEDQGSFEWSGGPTGNGCPQNGGGVDQTNCILSKLQSDMDYMNQNYFNSSSYLRVDNTPGSPTYMQATPTGKPTVLFFICESCWTNPAPDWTTIWNTLRSYTNSYGNGSGVAMFFIFRNADAFSHVQTSGGFAWVNWYGTDPYGLNYLSNYYSTAKTAVNQNPTLLSFGGGWKGFDETNAPWVTGTPRIMLQQCGNTWLQTMEEANNYYSGSNQLPFGGAVTWNDYEEGTEIETGIDNCLTLSASISGAVLSWTPTFSASTGSESTVSDYTIYSTTDGTNLTQLTTVPSGTHSINLNTFSLANGTYTIYVQAVGQPSTLNKISNGVSYAVGQTTSTITGQVTNISTGAGISGATVSDGSASTTTNSTGYYTFSGVAPGTYSVTASASGYTSSTKSATTTAGATSTINFQLATFGSIAGKVTNKSGSAIRNAAVAITGGLIATTANTTTNGGGKYNSGSIPVGTYTVTVSASGHTTQQKTATVSTGITTTVNFTMQ